METQISDTQIEQNVERVILENLYKSLDQRLGHPAGDMEICDEMEITLDEFQQILDRFKGLSLGSFQKESSRNGRGREEPMIRYIPDASQKDTFYIFHKSEIQKTLAGAIEALPKMERLIASLSYFDELTPKEIAAVLGINESRVSHLRTKATLRLRSKLSESGAV